MNNTLLQKRMPTLLGILLIVAGVIGTSFLVERGVIFEGRASPSETPENVRITNVSDTSFTVSYTTAGGVLGSVTFGEDASFGNSAIDDADQKDTIRPHTVHVITAKNAKPSTKYFFAIVSGQTTFLDNQKPFTVTTGPVLQSQSSGQKEIKGKIIFSEGAEETVAYVTSEKAQTLASRADSTGNYTLSLSSMRKEDLLGYVSLSETSILQMLIASKDKQSHITLFAKDANNIPTIVLSKDYDFTIGTTPIPTGTASGFVSLTATASANKAPQIVTPQKDEKFTDMQPLFRGTASPSAEIQVIIHSDEQLSSKIIADNNGTWTFRPQKPLSQGVHTITITTRDQGGILQTITRSFTVFAQGTQVGESATPSAAATPTKSPIATVTINPTPTVIPSVSPPTTPLPTRIPTVLPTKPPGAENMPAPGNSSVVPFGISAIVTTIGGILLFILTRGGTL